MEPFSNVADDEVVVAWRTGMVTRVSDNGTVTQQYDLPDLPSANLMDEDAAVDFVLNHLKNAGLSTAAWNRIVKYFEGVEFW